MSDQPDTPTLDRVNLPSDMNSLSDADLHRLADELRAHEFFADLDVGVVNLIATCGKNRVFRRGTVIATEGSDANEFFVLRRGRVALQVNASPTGTVVIQTLEAGDVLGWSWLFEPYRWSVEAVAVSDVGAIGLDGLCLRNKCDADPAMGYVLMKRFSRIMSARLEATRLQLLDLSGRASSR